MVLPFSLDIFNSYRSLCFTGGQYSVLLIKDDQFGQMTDREKTFPGITHEFCPSPLEPPSPPASGVSYTWNEAIQWEVKGRGLVIICSPILVSEETPLPHSS